MKEEYLHYIFDKRLLGKDFFTTDNKSLQIIDFGRLNGNAGPDFLDAKIQLDGQLWAGPIEFHVKASDWCRHQHQLDPAYGSVIAHFVYEADEIVTVGNFAIPTVELKLLIDLDHYRQYKSMVANKSELLCSSYLRDIQPELVERQKSQSLKDRLLQKSILFEREIEQLNGDYFGAYILLLARCFGGQVNQLPFEELARKIKRNWLAKLNYHPLKTEALFLGLSGFLADNLEDDPYIENLRSEFYFQRNLFGLSDHVVQGWKYSRMRPTNFPDRRIVQFARAVNYIASVGTFSGVFFNQALFKSEGMCLSEYWAHHYRIGNRTERKIATTISKDMIQLIQINVEIMNDFTMALLQRDEDQQSTAINRLKTIPAESNHIIKSWREAGLTLKSAYDSQALLALKKQMCIRKKCLFCAIGKSILNK
jgi:hypothetical protein